MHPRFCGALVLLLLAPAGCGRRMSAVPVADSIHRLAYTDRSKESTSWAELEAGFPENNDEIVAALSSGDDPAAAWASNFLMKHLLPSTIPKLKTLTRSTDEGTRFWGWRMLVDIEPLDTSFSDAMAEGLESRIEPRVSHAVLALRFTRGRVTATERLAKGLGLALQGEHKPGSNGGMAAAALAKLGPKFSLPVLEQALSDPDAAWWALDGLKLLGAGAQPALPKVDELTRSTAHEGQLSAKASEVARAIRAAH